MLISSGRFAPSAVADTVLFVEYVLLPRAQNCSPRCNIRFLEAELKMNGTSTFFLATGGFIQVYERLLFEIEMPITISFIAELETLPPPPDTFYSKFQGDWHAVQTLHFWGSVMMDFFTSRPPSTYFRRFQSQGRDSLGPQFSLVDRVHETSAGKWRQARCFVLAAWDSTWGQKETWGFTLQTYYSKHRRIGVFLALDWANS